MKASVVPASFFGIVLGLVGLGNTWREAARLWNLSVVPGEAIMFLGASVWLTLMVLYSAKWLWAHEQARAEFEHPIQCCFVGLAPVSTLLIALVAIPYSRETALTLFCVGGVGQLAFAVYRTGHLWRGRISPEDVTPALYLPSVAGSFVTAIVAGALGLPEVGRLFFGAGLFSWLALESVIVRRLYLEPETPIALRTTLGIQLAPPAVGAVAYLSVTNGPPDWFAQALLGYGLLQALIIGRLLPWIARQAFAPGYWAFTFGLTALALAALRFVERGLDSPVFASMATVLFVVANVAVGAIAIGTLWLLGRGRLLPTPVLTPAPAG